jgi:RND family efflux transporter MFP subunit
MKGRYMKKLIILLCLSVFSFGMGKGPALVNTAKVTKGVVNPLEEFIGTLNFSKTSAIASQSNGAAKGVNFEVGDRVKKGDVLVSIDSEILDSQIVSAKVTLSDAKRDYERYKTLKEQNAISQKVYDSSYLRFITSQAKLDELLTQKKQKLIKAPFDGIIVKKSIEVGEWLSAGKTVFTLINTGSVDMIFNLPTSYVYKLDKNQEYSIKLKDKTISSKLYAAIPQGDKRTRTFPVKFKSKVQNQFLYDGMEVRISLPRNKKQESLVVPRDGVIKRFGQNVVFVNSDGKAMMIPVKIIGYNTTSVAVEGKGLFDGADVVVKGNERIFPNQAIKSINK